jgi:peroxiredoxin
LVVLGVNNADDAKIAKEFVIANGITFPIILDCSTDARMAMNKYEMNGMTAVPMTYLIGRDGKVIEAWYGYEEGRAERALKKLKW